MKIVGFWRDQQIRLGFLLENEILEPGLAGSLLASEEEQFFRDAISFIYGADLAFKAAARLLEQRPTNALHPLDSVKLAAPMWPSTILCAGSNYREHNEEKAGSPTSGPVGRRSRPRLDGGPI